MSLELNGRRITPTETSNLISHLWNRTTSGELVLRDMVPSQWHDPVIGFCLSKGMLNLAAELSELEQLGRVSEAVLGSPHGPRGQVLAAQALVARHSTAALPLSGVLLDRISDMGSRKDLRHTIDAQRETLDRPAEVWNLLLLPGTAKPKDAVELLRAIHAGAMEWTAEEFGLAAMHPAVRELLGGLVFTFQSRSGPKQSLLPFTVEPGDTVTVAHPLMVPGGEVAQWRSRIAKDGRTPPFDQWAASAQTVNWRQLHVDPSRLMLHLEARGWQRGRPDSGGIIRSHTKRFTGMQLRARLEYTGIPVRFGNEWVRQSITALTFSHLSSDVPIEGGHPIALAQVHEDLAGLES